VWFYLSAPLFTREHNKNEVNLNAPLPFVAGVGPSCQWLPAGPWKTVIDFFKEQYPHVHATTWKARMAKGQVMDETGRRVDAETAFRVGACIFYYRELENEKTIPFREQVLYEDEHILVADKPHFLPVIPSGKFLHETLLVRLRKQRATEDLAHPSSRSGNCRSDLVFPQSENKRPLHLTISESQGEKGI